MLNSKVYLLLGCIALVLATAGTAYARSETHSFSVSSAFGDRDVFSFDVTATGTIRVEAHWTGTAQRLALILNGPRRPHLTNPDAYYARQEGRSPVVITYDVTQEDLSRGTGWKASIVNFSEQGRASGTITIEYPPRIIHHPVQVHIENPYEIPPNVVMHTYKGQLHAHTTRSDGDYSLEQVKEMYARLGYDFLAPTEHNLVGFREGGYTRYPWRNRGFLSIPACESGDWWENHLVAIGVTSCPEECASCSWGWGLVECSIGENQRRINQVLNQDGLAILAHPRSRSGTCGPGVGPSIERGWSLAKMKGVQGYHAIEIVSGNVTSLAEWDHLLSVGRRVWGVASDDFHSSGDRDRGWIVVISPHLTEEDILRNIKRGNFYAYKRLRDGSPLPRINLIWVINDTIHIRVIDVIKLRFISSHGRTLREITYYGVADQPRAASYRCDGSEGYVRIEVEGAYGVVYSQPLFVGRLATEVFP